MMVLHEGRLFRGHRVVSSNESLLRNHAGIRVTINRKKIRSVEQPGAFPFYKSCM